MGNVCRVVHAQADGDDQVDAWDGVNGQAPEVHESSHVDQTQDHTDQDEEAADKVAEEEEGGDEDADESEANVPVQLLGDDLISLPGGVALREGEHMPRCQVGSGDQVFDPVHSRYVLFRTWKNITDIIGKLTKICIFVVHKDWNDVTNTSFWKQTGTLSQITSKTKVF